MSRREAGAGVGGNPPFSAPSLWAPPVPTNSVANNIFYISCCGADDDLAHPFLFVFSYKAENWIHLNPRQGTAVFRNPPRRKTGKGRKECCWETWRLNAMGSPTGKQISYLVGQGPVLFHAEQSNGVHWEITSLYHWQTGSYSFQAHLESPHTVSKHL